MKNWIKQKQKIVSLASYDISPLKKLNNHRRINIKTFVAIQSHACMYATKSNLINAFVTSTKLMCCQKNKKIKKMNEKKMKKRKGKNKAQKGIKNKEGKK